MKSEKISGVDGLPPELFKRGGHRLNAKVVKVFDNIWTKCKVPQDFRETLIVHFFKRKVPSSV